ncbi:uncharacterized [Tachysurus ichikawai]
MWESGWFQGVPEGTADTERQTRLLFPFWDCETGDWGPGKMIKNPVTKVLALMGDDLAERMYIPEIYISGADG